MNDKSKREAAEVSFVMPCYNEQDALPFTVTELVQAFHAAGIRLELVACDNGSRDNTGEIVKDFVRKGLPILYHRVEVNEGYGNGVLQGLAVCSAQWIGIIAADGQVDASDVVRLFQIVRNSDGRLLAKVRRRFRMDGLARKIVSVVFNCFVWILWPRLGSMDINGTPKIFHRDVLMAMDLQSKRWFLDAEIMVKAHYLGVRVVETNVFARMRSNGLSHVRSSTCVEFVLSLLRFKFGSALSKWRRHHADSLVRSGHTTAPV